MLRQKAGNELAVSYTGSFNQSIFSVGNKEKSISVSSGSQSVQTAADPPYFGRISLVSEMNERFKRKVGTSPLPLDRAQQIVEGLFAKHQQAKQKLHQIKEEARFRERENLPRKSVERFVIPGDVVQRNEVWLRERTRKRIECKEKRLLEGLKECTFTPYLQAGRQSEIYRRNRSSSQNQSTSQGHNACLPSPRKLTPTRRDLSNSSFKSAKKFINMQIMGLT